MSLLYAALTKADRAELDLGDPEMARRLQQENALLRKMVAHLLVAVESGDRAAMKKALADLEADAAHLT